MKSHYITTAPDGMKYHLRKTATGGAHSVRSVPLNTHGGGIGQTFKHCQGA